MGNNPLAHIPLFAPLSQEESGELSQLMRTLAVAAHQTLFWIGEPGTEFYVVQSGEVEVVQPDEQGKEVTLNHIGGGGFFGELSLLDGGVRTATVRTVKDSVFLILGQSDFQEFLEKNPNAAIHLLSEMGKRQRHMMQMMRGVPNVNQIMEERQTFGHRFADRFASLMGSWTFIIAQTTIYTLWIIANVVLVGDAWDPYPFCLLGIVLSAVAGYAAPLIMMSQSRQSEKDRVRAELEYQVNVKAHEEVMQLHKKMDDLTRLLGPHVPSAPSITRAADEGTNPALS